MPHIKISNVNQNKLEVHYAEPYEDVSTGFTTPGFVQVVADEGAVLSDKNIGELQSALALARRRAYPRLRLR
jgi:hypothetical protein